MPSHAQLEHTYRPDRAAARARWRRGAHRCATRTPFCSAASCPISWWAYMVPGITDPIPYRQTHFCCAGVHPQAARARVLGYICGSAVRAAHGCRFRLRARASHEYRARRREAIDRIHFPQRFEGEAAADPALASASDAAHEPSDQRTLFDFFVGHLGPPACRQPMEHAREPVPRRTWRQAQRTVPHQKAGRFRWVL